MFLCDTKSLVKLWTEKREGIEIHFYEVEHQKGGEGWEVHIVSQSEGRARFVSAKGEVRQFRQLNSAITELAEIVPELKEYKVFRK